MNKIKIIIPTFFILVGSLLNAQKIAVVDVQKTFDGYQKTRMPVNAWIDQRKLR